MTCMRDHVFVPLYDVGIVASLQSFDACVVQVPVIIAEEPNSLLRIHFKGDHKTLENELGRCEGLVEQFWHVYVSEIAFVN